MLQRSGAIIDDGSPYALGSIGKNIRITAIKTPLLDDDVGICASIRIVSSARISKDKLSKGTATESMLEFLAGILRYSASRKTKGLFTWTARLQLIARNV